MNGKFGIIGAQLDIVDEGTVFAGKAESGSDVAEAVYVLEDGEKLFELTSKGTLKRGIYNGELVVSAEGQTIVSLKSENVDTEAEDAFIGKITVTSPALSDANPALAMLSVSVEGTKEGNKQTLAIGVGMGDGALATVTVSTEQYAAEKGKLHENTTEDAEEWIMSLYTSEKFSEILENSGLSGILESLMYMDSDDYYDDEYYDDEYDYYDEEFTDEELGYDDGYLDGYYDGYDGEYKECYGECMNEDKADSEEYMDAYDLGYEEGYADGQSDLEADQSIPDDEAGYDDGYTDGYYDGYGGEYKAGYGDCIDEDRADSEEYMDAYDRGYEEGYAEGVAEMKAFEAETA